MALFVTLMIQAFSSLSLMAVPVLVPIEPGVPRLSANGLGLYLVFGYVGAVLGSLGAGPLVARFGAIRVSQLALLLSAVGMVVAALWPVLVLPAALAIGLGYGPITPASSHLLIQTTAAHQRNLVFSIKQTGVPLGVVMTGLLIPPLGLWLGWTGCLLVLAAGCALVALAASPVRAALDAQSAVPLAQQPVLSVRGMFGQLRAPLALIARHPLLRVLAAVSFVFSGLQIAFSSYLVSYLRADLGQTAVLAGSLLALSQLGGMAGRIGWGFLADRFVRPLTMLCLLALLMATCALATAQLAHWPLPGWLLGALMLAYGASASGWNGVYLAEVARRAPKGEAAMATSGTLACTFIGVLVGAPLFGWIVSGAGGYRWAFSMQGLTALGVAWLLWANRVRFAAH